MVHGTRYTAHGTRSMVHGTGYMGNMGTRLLVHCSDSTMGNKGKFKNQTTIKNVKTRHRIHAGLKVTEKKSRDKNKKDQDQDQDQANK